jgi:hypothetical protein
MFDNKNYNLKKLFYAFIIHIGINAHYEIIRSSIDLNHIFLLNKLL